MTTLPLETALWLGALAVVNHVRDLRAPSKVFVGDMHGMAERLLELHRPRARP